MENKRKILTLCCLKKDGQILLGLKKRGFGASRWNGFGGKLKKGETIEQAAKRETREECGIKITELEKLGILDFEFKSKPRLDSRKQPLVDARRADILEVHLFDIKKFTGEPKETEEMRSQWFALDKIPYADMWPDDQFWIPLFLQDKKFKGYFLFDQDGKKILRKKLEVAAEL